jgi:hypothetical protein
MYRDNNLRYGVLKVGANSWLWLGCWLNRSWFWLHCRFRGWGRNNLEPK